MATALLAVTVCAIPIHESKSDTQNERAPMIQPRDPQRIIPDTTDYLNDMLDILGLDSVLLPSPTPPAETPAATKGVEQEVIATPTATPAMASMNLTPSPTWNVEQVTYSTTIKTENIKPIENIQIGAGWKGSNHIQASDVPFIMNAVYSALADRFNDVVDSSDEVGLEK
ncbi:hypothetical protein N7520_000660 [Penicillium odoratum]|uniref:uncharacterized protein n=1 Tax=Penicillium odoratum TaxID=1167516 RepID=UPI0025467C67|nr:uncharacterized protein N7520_000660 [Penicillium odoratum]KAJ5777414.1 hypothetical protein N7520_000660 [Penicillium odoratum]